MSLEGIKKLVWDHISSKQDELIDLCSSLVKIPSVNPPGDTREVASFLSEYLQRDYGLAPERYEAEEGYANLIVKMEGERPEPNLIFSGHMDVVPPGDLKRWDFPPFSGEIKEGKILGRGACDTKGGLAAAIFACTSLLDLNIELPGTLTLVITADEERDSKWGARWLVENEKVKGDACLVTEPSCLEYAFVAEKGLCRFKLIAGGKSAHGSVPMIGENAIEKMANAMPLVKGVCIKEAKVPEDMRPLVENSKKFIVEHTGLERSAEAIDHVTVNFGVIKGGTKINIVPDLCALEVDARIPIGFTGEEVKREVGNLLKETDLDVQWMVVEDPSYTALDEKIVKLLNRGAKEVTSKSPTHVILTGASDGRYFRRAGIPSIVYGPGDLKLAHSYNEYLKISELIAASKIFAGLATEFMSRA